MERLWNIEGCVLWKHQEKVPLEFPLLVPSRSGSSKLVPSGVLANHDYQYGGQGERPGVDDLWTNIRELHREIFLWIDTGNSMWKQNMDNWLERERHSSLHSRSPLLISSKMTHRKWGYFRCTKQNFSLMLSHPLKHAVACGGGINLFSIMLFLPDSQTRSICSQYAPSLI